MEGGTFWPLSYWEKKGLDIERIEKCSPPSCIREDPVLGTCYKVVLVSDSKRRQFDKVLQDVSTLTPESQVASTAASSSGDMAMRALTIQEMIAREKEQKQQEKQEKKDLQIKITKATKPADAMLKVLSAIKANIKLDKLPPALAVVNPLEDSIATITAAIEQVKGEYSDAKAAKLMEEIQKAKQVAKMMKIFT